MTPTAPRGPAVLTTCCGRCQAATEAGGFWPWCAQVPLFGTAEDAEGQRVVAGLEPIFNSRLNPGNNLLIRIIVRLPVQCRTSGPPTC